ncbi:hypothetical protein HOD08_01950 [bacterium]|nr:hypothetical protein [bacterium]
MVSKAYIENKISSNNIENYKKFTRELAMDVAGQKPKGRRKRIFIGCVGPAYAI